MNSKYCVVLVLCLFTIGCDADEQEPAVSTDEANGECPEEWLQLYDVEHLMDEAVQLEVAAQAYGVDATIVDTSSPMPAACTPAMNAHAALEQENASVSRQVEAAQSNDPNLTFFKIEGVLRQSCIGNEIIQPPPGCIAGGEVRREHIDGSWASPYANVAGCSPAQCSISQTGNTSVVYWTIGSVN
jgi:hypothetical protein